MSMITITAHDGETFKAYIAMPETHSADISHPAPAVIVIQEIFGINQELRDKCDDLAAQGYIAVCPDLFWRIEPGIELVDSAPEQLERAFELFGVFDVDQGMKDLSSTLGHIRRLDGHNGKVGCVGYCLGGKLAYMMATHTNMDASVSYYGVGIQDMLDEASTIQNPVMLHIAQEDEFVPTSAQKQIIARFADVDHVQTHTYANADHAFARGNGMHYKADAAELANTRTRAFLEKCLK